MKKKKILVCGKSISYSLKNYWIFWEFKWFLQNEKFNSTVKGWGSKFGMTECRATDI